MGITAEGVTLEDGTPIKVEALRGDQLRVITVGMYSTDDPQPVTINRVPLRADMHFYRWADGSWRLCPEWAADEYELRRQYSPLVYRADDGTVGHHHVEPSRSAVEKITAMFSQAAEQWARENGERLEAADDRFRSEEIRKRGEEIDELDARIRGLRREIKALRYGGASIRYRVNHYQSGFRDTTRHVVTKDGAWLPDLDARYPEDHRVTAEVGV